MAALPLRIVADARPLLDDLALLAWAVEMSPMFRGALEALRSMPVDVAVADEVDFWSNSGGQVIVDSNCGEVVDLVGQPAVAPVPHPKPEPAILACCDV